jgi:hypothetical protein
MYAVNLNFEIIKTHIRINMSYRSLIKREIYYPIFDKFNNTKKRELA